MQDDNTMQSLYQYPCTVTKYKSGKEISKTVVTQNNRGSRELRSLYPELNKVCKRLGDKENRPKRKTTLTSTTFPDPEVWRMWFELGK